MQKIVAILLGLGTPPHTQPPRLYKTENNSGTDEFDHRSRRVLHGELMSALVPSQAMLRSPTSMCSAGHTIDATVVAIIDATRSGGELAVAAR